MGRPRSLAAATEPEAGVEIEVNGNLSRPGRHFGPFDALFLLAHPHRSFQTFRFFPLRIAGFFPNLVS